MRQRQQREPMRQRRWGAEATGATATMGAAAKATAVTETAMTGATATAEEAMAVATVGKVTAVVRAGAE